MPYSVCFRFEVSRGLHTAADFFFLGVGGLNVMSKRDIPDHRESNTCCRYLSRLTVLTDTFRYTSPVCVAIGKELLKKK